MLVRNSARARGYGLAGMGRQNQAWGCQCRLIRTVKATGRQMTRPKKQFLSSQLKMAAASQQLDKQFLEDVMRAKGDRKEDGSQPDTEELLSSMQIPGQEPEMGLDGGLAESLQAMLLSGLEGSETVRRRGRRPPLLTTEQAEERVRQIEARIRQVNELLGEVQGSPEAKLAEAAKGYLDALLENAVSQLDAVRSRETEQLSEFQIEVNYLTKQLEVVGEKPQVYRKVFWQGLRRLGKTPMSTGDKPPYELLAMSFELAKMLPPSQKRSFAIRVAGDVLYGFKDGIRMDPINEVEYMDALALFGNSYRAIEIWKSRKDKPDVKDSVYWSDVGILYYIQAKRLRKAQELAEETLAKYNYVPPRCLVALIREYALVGEDLRVAEWYKQLVGAVTSAKKIEHSKEVRQNFDQTEDALAWFNRKVDPTVEDLEAVLKALLHNSFWDEAMDLMDRMRELGLGTSVGASLSVLDKWTRAMFERGQTGRLSGRAHRRGQPPRAASRQLTVLISKIVSTHPEVLDNANFYESWMRGLAGLGRHADAMGVVDAMVERGIQVTTAHATSLVKALLKQKQLDGALDLLAKIENREPDSCLPQPTDRLYALFIQYGSNRHNHELVQDMLRRMDAHSVEITDASFNALAFYYRRHRDFASAFDLFRQTLASGTGLTNRSYRAMWLVLYDYYKAGSNYQSQPLDPRELLASMMTRPRLTLSKDTFEACVETLLVSGDHVAVAGLLCYMDTVRGIKLDALVVTHLFQLAKRAKRASSSDDTSLAAFRDGEFESKTKEDAGIPWSSVVETLCESAWRTDVGLTLEQAQQLADAMSDSTR